MTLPNWGSAPTRRRPAGLVTAFVLAATLTTARASSPPPLTREQAELQGVWTLETMEVDGRKADDDQTRGWLLVIRGDQYNPGSGQTSVEYNFRIDPTLNPKAIDLIPHDGPYGAARSGGSTPARTTA